MTTMLEKAARAICAEAMKLPTDDPGVSYFWPDHTPAARAALLAIREPSEGMIREGGAAVFDEVGYSELGFTTSAAREAFTAMIDAILNEDA